LTAKLTKRKSMARRSGQKSEFKFTILRIEIQKIVPFL